VLIVDIYRVRVAHAPHQDQEERVGFIKSSRVFAASEVVSNLLAGSVYEFVPEESQVSIGILASAVGFTGAVSSGSDILLEDGSTIDMVRVAGQGPVYPDDYALTDVALVYPVIFRMPNVLCRNSHSTPTE